MGLERQTGFHEPREQFESYSKHYGRPWEGWKKQGDDMIAFMIFKKLLCSGARVDTERPIRRPLL